MSKIYFFTLAVVITAGGVSSYAQSDIWSNAVIKEGDDYDYLYVHDSPPDHTLVHMIGGSVYDLFALDSSTITITGGQVTDLYAKNSSTLNIGGGTISDVMSYDSSTVNITGGEIPVGLQSEGSSVVNIAGGTMGSCIYAGDSSVMNISGGLISDYLAAYHLSTVNIYGRDLAYDPESLFPSPWGPGYWEGGKVTGKWNDGSDFAINLVDNIGGTGSNNTFSHVVLHEMTRPCIYVDDDAGGGDGSSWAQAHRYLQDALADANSASKPVEIRVAQGIYKPDQGAGVDAGDRSATFRLKSGVRIEGGYAGFGQPEPDKRDVQNYQTILSGDLLGNDGPNFGNHNDNTYHIVTASEVDSTAVLDGFTVTAGNANVGYPSNDGAGVLLESGNPVLLNCTIAYNLASGSGGGVYSDRNAGPTIERCKFIGNRAHYSGGALQNYGGENLKLTHCVFQANSAASGGAVRNLLGSMTFRDCIFSGNIADEYYGGQGGALHHWGNGTSDHFIIINCTVVGNRVTGTEQAGAGGGLYVYDGSVRADNCIFWGNRTAGVGGESAQMYLYDGEFVLFNCCIEGFEGGGTGNISDDPLLVDADGADNTFGTADDNLRLLAGSPCVDAGNNYAVSSPNAVDIDGNPRILNETVDIGAYEGTNPGILLSAEALEVAEGQTETFTVSLSSDPQGPVIVTVYHYSGDTDINVKSGGVLEFDSSDYGLAKTVTIGAEQDGDFVNGSALIHVSAPGLPTVGVTVRELDDERSTTLYVDKNAQGADDGSSWADAFRNLQDALNSVITNPQFKEIRVAQGTYRPDQGKDVIAGDQTASFALINNVVIAGGYAGSGRDDANLRDIEAYETILSGDLAGNDADVHQPSNLLEEPTRSENSYHVVTAPGCDGTAILEGFTITGGNANGAAEAQKNGGGVYNDRATLSRCTVNCNAAFYAGGGIYFYYAYHTQGGLLNDCVISHNSARSGGGVSGCTEMVNCVVTGNSATEYGGGGISLGYSCETGITDCLITGNESVGGGGGVSVGASGGKPVFTRCTIIGNSTNSSGGGVSVDGCTCGSTPQFNECHIIANQADDRGGGVFSYGYALTSLNNCLISGNTALTNGGGICDDDSGGSAMVNCTLSGNTAGNRGGGLYYVAYSRYGHELTNTIVWHNSAGEEQTNQLFIEDYEPSDYTEGTKINHSCIHNLPGGIEGTGNISSDPLFIDADGQDGVLGTEDDDLHLKADSPCINNGNDYWVPPGAVDLDGRPRIADGRVDMGAYETHGPREWFVNDAADPDEDGSKEHPFDTIQEAIDAACDGDSVTVMDGTYRGEGNRDIELSKAITVRSQNGPEQCVIDCQGSEEDPHRGFDVSAGEGQECILEGFTITNGYMVGEEWRGDNDGGAIACHGGPIVRNNRIIGNRAPLGGGISCGMGAAQIIGNVISENTAVDGGGVNCYERAVVRNNVITKNRAERGGGIWTWEDGPATIVNNIISGNWAETAGGGIGVLWDYQTIIAGNVIAGNSSGGRGGGIYLSTDPAIIINNTLIDNGAPEGAGIYKEYGASPTIVNCIIWSYGDDLFECAATYSCIKDADAGEGNIHTSPLLVDPEQGNYRPAPTSPCIDAGDSAAVPSCLLTDAAGNPRIANARVDMGAYEFVRVPYLVAHWKLDEIEGPTAKDASGLNDGTLHGNPQWRPSAGFVDGALEFDGQGDYVNCGSTTLFDITEQITVAAWVKIGSVNMDWQTIIAKGDSAWRLSTANDQRRFHFAVTGGPPWNYINGEIEVGPGEWHHVCGTYDGMNLRLYIDGVEDPAGPVTELNGVTTNHYDVLIGENQERPQRYWDGMLDDIRIYDHALSAAAVAELSKRPRIIYVDAGVSGVNDGLAWQTAFYSLQDALAIATSGDEIRVAEGLYTPDDGRTVTFFDRTATFQLIDGVTIKGGYAGFGQPDPDVRDIELYQSILSGDLLKNDAPEMSNRSDNSRHVVTGSETGETAVLDGFTITAGYADGIDTPYPFINNGAGMYNEKGSPTVTHCTFTDNVAVIYDSEYGGLGAAMYNYMSSPVVRNCTFTENVTDGWGAAVYNESASPTITGCTFTANSGGAMRFMIEGHAIVANCLFLANPTGAIGCSYGASPAIENCRFIANVANYDGSALWCYENANPTVANCLFLANTSVLQSGGAISCLGSSPKITNCTFSQNTADDEGGAIACRRDSNPELTNCILWANNAPQGAQIGLRYDRPWPTAPLSTAEITISYCSIEGGLDAMYTNEHCRVNWGIGNIDVDPRFVLPGYWDAGGTPDDANDDLWVDGDYHLKSAGWRWDTGSQEWTFDRLTSRCIDAGKPASSLGAEPLSVHADPNNEWGVNLRINMGVYGGTAEAGIPPHDWAILADLTNDGLVDWQDYVHAASEYTKNLAEPPADLNRNAVLDLRDIALLCDDWLKVTSWH